MSVDKMEHLEVEHNDRNTYPRVGWGDSSRLDPASYQRLRVVQGSGFSKRIQKPSGLQTNDVYPTASEAINSSRTNYRLQNAIRDVGVVGRPPSLCSSRNGADDPSSFAAASPRSRIRAWARGELPSALAVSGTAHGRAGPHPRSTSHTPRDAATAPARPAVRVHNLSFPGADASAGGHFDRAGGRSARSGLGPGSRGASGGSDGGASLSRGGAEQRTPREVLLSISPPAAAERLQAFLAEGSPDL
jgi:hypothetical protein